MKKKLICLALAVLLALSLCVPSLAAEEYGVIYDETDALNSPSVTYLGEQLLPMISEQFGIELRVDVLTVMDYDSVEEAAEAIYDAYGYGFRDDRRGLVLTILMEPSGSTYAMEDGNWCVYLGGTDNSLREGGLDTKATLAVAPYMAEQAWNGDDLTMSATALSQATEAMANAVLDYFGGETEPDAPAEPAVGPEEGTGPDADTSLGYVIDAANLLTYEQWAQLELLAEEISLRHGVGVYIVTVDDYTDYGTGGVFDVTTQIYHGYDFGVGSERNGAMLLLSMESRDFATFFYGEKTEYAFDSYGQEKLEDSFLDKFGENDWYGGFTGYLDACEDYLTQAEAGKPVRAPLTGSIGLVIVLACLASLAVCMSLKRRMKTVRQKAEANEYVCGSLALTASDDRYTHTTETRRTIENSSSSGSSSHTGGGGSGRSGSF